MKKNKSKIVSLLLSVVVLTSVLLSGCGNSSGTIIVASKDFNENIILGEIISQLVEANTDLKVTRKLNMGGSFVCFEAIKNGDIDIYTEYTGTALVAELEMDATNDSDEAYNIVSEEFDKQFGIKWLEPLGLNNTYRMTVTQEVYQEYGIETISELAEISENLVFGSDHEYLNREDGYAGLIETYGLKFKGDPVKMSIPLRYQAIGNGDCDVTNTYATDGEILQYNLHVLEDDKGYFAPYFASPIIRNDTLEKYPELEDVLNSLAGLLDDPTMIELNYKVGVEGAEVEAVATEFLQSNGLI